MIIKYIIVINAAAFIAFGLDKWKAKRGGWRIREATLLGLALVGGAAGGLLGMYVFRHKTRKWYFRYTLPLMLAVHVILLYIAM